MIKTVLTVFLVFCTTFVCADSISARTPTSNSLIVGPTVQVSAGNSDLLHIEPYTGADPTNPQNLIACSMIQRRSPQIDPSSTVVYLSNDGGGSWRQAFNFPSKFSTGDIVCGFTSDGKPMFASLRGWPTGNVPHRYSGSDMVFYIRDQGRWRSTRLPFSDREFILTRPNALKASDTLYIITRAGRVGIVFGPQSSVSVLNVFRSKDAGKHFDTMTAYQYSPQFAIFGQGGIFSDGALIAPLNLFDAKQVFESKPVAPPRIKGYVKVVLPGEPYSDSLRRPIVVSKLFGCDWLTSTFYVPTLAIDDSESRYRDRAYLAWTDYRHGRCEALLSHSSDRGHAWSPPIVISDVRGVRAHNMGPDDTNPVLAVNRDGILGAMWYDRRNQPNDIDWQPRFAISIDGGNHFGPSVALTHHVNDFNRPVQQLAVGIGMLPEKVKHAKAKAHAAEPGKSRSRFDILFRLNSSKASAGETSGMSVDPDGVFHPVWVDNSTGVDQLWTTSVRVARNAVSTTTGRQTIPTTAAALEKIGPRNKPSDQRVCPVLVNASPANNITLDIGPVWLNRMSGLISTDAYVLNTSRHAMQTPLIFRVDSLSSMMGTVSALDVTTAAIARPCWSFRPRNDSNTLDASAVSRPVHLVFKIRNLQRASYPVMDRLMYYVHIKGSLFKNAKGD